MNNLTFKAAMLAGALALAGGSATAQSVVSPKDASVGDVVTKPLSDLNLKKDEIPPILIAARENAYTTAGLRSCTALQAEVRRLDAVLGDDIDIAQLGDKGGLKPGNIAKSVVGSLIPFGGIIREISGANEAQRQWNVAIYAGTARRAFLKGIGAQKGCRYPARPASSADVSLIKAAREREDAMRKQQEEAEKARRDAPKQQR